MKKAIRWRVLDKRRLLQSAMEQLAGDGHLSFEGDLSATKLFDLSGSSEHETATLKRGTIWPKQQFVV